MPLGAKIFVSILWLALIICVLWQSHADKRNPDRKIKLLPTIPNWILCRPDGKYRKYSVLILVLIYLAALVVVWTFE